ncbi:MAG: creatininase family protein [Beijerinckiaceae bacterium]
MKLPSRHWADLSARHFRTLPMQDVIAVLPIAAIEQHGPHLPVGVDTMIAEGYLARVLKRLPDDLPALFLPVQAIGKSNEHVSFPGTLTLSAETVIRAWTDIGESVHRAGVRKIVFVNSHGGNIAPMDIVARELRVRFGMIAVTCSWHRLGYPEGMFSADELRLGIHGGEIETALMRAFRDDLVDMKEAKNFVPQLAAWEKKFAVLRGTQPVGVGWMSEDLNPDGAMGNAAAATKANGEASADFGAQAFIQLLRDVQSFERG